MIYCNHIVLSLYPLAVGPLAFETRRLDRIAIGLSGLCVIHCVASAALVALLASAGALGSPLVHEVGLTLAMIIGAYALGRGFLDHGFILPVAIGSVGLSVMAGALTMPEGWHEAVFTVIGVMIVALAHRLNFIAAHHDF